MAHSSHFRTPQAQGPFWGPSCGPPDCAKLKKRYANVSKLKKHISSSEYSFVSDLLKTTDLKKKIVTFDISSKKKIILISITKNITSSGVENLGAKFYDILKGRISFRDEFD